MPRMKTQLTPELADYLARHSRQDEVLARVERETAEMPRAGMVTTPDEAALLTMLARLVGARSALEIGTFTGYGAISIARGLAEGGRLTCLEVSEEYAEIASRNLESAGLLDRVEVVVGPADEALRAMPEEPTFDYVFIDADKTAYPTLLRPRAAAAGAREGCSCSTTSSSAETSSRRTTTARGSWTSSTTASPPTSASTARWSSSPTA